MISPASRRLAWCVPLVLFAGDALAWGLQTHLYFAQYLVFAAPFADPELRRAVFRFPRLVLAGACLPDLAIAGRVLGTPAFRRTHGWATLRRVCGSPAGDEDRAIALGYSSHLLSDIVAHHLFVPEHERRVCSVPYVTHAIAEWAMDRHVAAAVLGTPGDVLLAERKPVAEFAARRLRCPMRLASRALELLARADSALRASPIPRACLSIVRGCERRLAMRFDAYVSETTRRLPQVAEIFDAGEPALLPEPERSMLCPAWRNGRPLLPARLV